MPICEWCNQEFDVQDAKEEFESETLYLSYSNVRKCLCGSCAVQVIDDLVDGIYFETCERCGKTFDYILDSHEFNSHFSECSGTILSDYWDRQILCCDCALNQIDIENNLTVEDDTETE